MTNFEKWFKNSKVVDGTGRPLPVYHGTRTGGFDTFTPNMRKGEQLGFGVHFAEEKDLADRYAYDSKVARKGKSAQVFECYLSIQNPLNADCIVFEGTAEFELALACAGKKLMTQADETGRKAAYLQAALDIGKPEKVAKIIQDAGYDGIKYTAVISSTSGRDRKFHPCWLVFKSNQIKAISNSGDWSETQDSIYRNPAAKRKSKMIRNPKDVLRESTGVERARLIAKSLKEDFGSFGIFDVYGGDTGRFYVEARIRNSNYETATTKYFFADKMDSYADIYNDVSNTIYEVSDRDKRHPVLLSIYLNKMASANGDKFESKARGGNILIDSTDPTYGYHIKQIKIRPENIKSREDAYVEIKKKIASAVQREKFKAEKPELYKERLENAEKARLKSEEKKREQERADKEMERIANGGIPEVAPFEKSKLIYDILEEKLTNMLPDNEIISMSHDDKHVKVYVCRSNKNIPLTSIDVARETVYNEAINKVIVSYRKFSEKEDEDRRKEEEKNKEVNIFKVGTTQKKETQTAGEQKKPLTAFAKMQAEQANSGLTRAERAKYIAQYEKEKSKNKPGSSSGEYLNKMYSLKKNTNTRNGKVRRNPADDMPTIDELRCELAEWQDSLNSKDHTPKNRASLKSIIANLIDEINKMEGKGNGSNSSNKNIDDLLSLGSLSTYNKRFGSDTYGAVYIIAFGKNSKSTDPNFVLTNIVDSNPVFMKFPAPSSALRLTMDDAKYILNKISSSKDLKSYDKVGIATSKEAGYGNLAKLECAIKKNPSKSKKKSSASVRRNPKGTAIQSTYKIYSQDGKVRSSTKYIVPSKLKYGFTLSNNPHYFSSVSLIGKKIKKSIEKYYEDRHGKCNSDIIINYIAVGGV